MKGIKYLHEASREIAAWLEWELESLELFHAYAHRFDKTAGSNVYTEVLEDALRARGLTLEQFKADVTRKAGA